jgi:hypothetical protein
MFLTVYRSAIEAPTMAPEVEHSFFGHSPSRRSIDLPKKSPMPHFLRLPEIHPHRSHATAPLRKDKLGSLQAAESSQAALPVTGPGQAGRDHRIRKRDRSQAAGLSGASGRRFGLRPREQVQLRLAERRTRSAFRNGFSRDLRSDKKRETRKLKAGRDAQSHPSPIPVHSAPHPIPVCIAMHSR